MNLQFVAREVSDRLSTSVADNLKAYLTGKTAGLIKTSDCRISRITATDAPNLIAENGECLPDAECSKRVFQWLSTLTPVQAADERLWVYLSHVTYAEYMHERWKTGLNRAEKQADVVIDRWFFKGEGYRTKMHNGISRLWWFGHVTYDATRPNPFELTDTLLSLQDIQTAFLERSLGLCRPLVRIVLEVIRKYADQLQKTPKQGDVIQEWAKEIHIRGGAYLLDAVPEPRLSFVIENSLRDRIKAA